MIVLVKSLMIINTIFITYQQAIAYSFTFSYYKSVLHKSNNQLSKYLNALNENKCSTSYHQLKSQQIKHASIELGYNKWKPIYKEKLRMLSGASHTTSFDNINHFVYQCLIELLNDTSEIYILANSFSLNAYQAMQPYLDKVKSFNFLYSKPTFTTETEDSIILSYTNISAGKLREFFINKLEREHNLFGNDLEIKLHNTLNQKYRSKQCLDWINSKCTFKSMLQDVNVPGFILIKNAEHYFLITGITDFSAYDLGYQRANKPLTFNQVYNQVHDLDIINQVVRQFHNAWTNKQFSKDVTSQVINNFNIVYEETSPETIYYQTLNYIFSEFIDEANADFLPNDKVNYQKSVIWNKLFNYQKDAATAIINKLEKFNGCILADSVGLGKTFTALAVINYYTLRNKNILVLCPKKLFSNWNIYIQNNRHNILVSDRFNYKLLHHTDLTRNSGLSSSGVDLDGFNWDNFDLIVIDESHNFRNGGNIQKITNPQEEHKLNRYETLLKNAICGGVKTKVLMLSATPVNNRFYDLKNQLALAYECNSEIINDKLNISTDINSVFKQAQKAYNAWSKQDINERTTKNLARRLGKDFFRVLDAFTIARSRKHIEMFYANSGNEIGKFPTRLKPISFEPSITDLANACRYSELSANMQELSLACYRPSDYILDTARNKYLYNKEYQFDIEFTGREQGLIRLLSINLFKRLESSIYSLLLSVNNLIAKQDELLKRIENFKHAHQKKSAESTISDAIIKDFDFSDEDEFDESEFSLETDSYIGSKHTVISFTDLNLKAWSTDIAQDKEILEHIAAKLTQITPIHDLKLKQLIEIIEHKCAHPINDNNRKILIFTAFADTANYLYQQLTKYFAKTKLDLKFALVQGDSGSNSCTLKAKLKKLDDILSCFSPRSRQKENYAALEKVNEEIDILIATDCISEGQNLQDCDYIINYDIHWNPVRLIQRFGRVDRIGSTNNVIQMVNFWPELDLDEYINLKARVEQRMKITNLAATGDDNILEEEQTELEFRKRQLERLKNDIVDLDEVSGGFSIMDLGLDDFRQDLLAYTKKNPKLAKLPTGLSALVQVPNGHNAQAHALASPFGAPLANNEQIEQQRVLNAFKLGIKPGIILILRNRNSKLKDNRNNILHPFYMVYIDDHDHIICNQSNPKQILEILRFLCRDQHFANHDLCQEFNAQTNNYENMESYSHQLKLAIADIVQQKTKANISSLFSKGPSSATTGNFHAEQDFELLDFLIVRP